MKRLIALVLPLVLFLLLALSRPLAPGAVDSRGGRPPNIVLVVADDLGYAELGSYGQKRIRTPHLDRLAAEGLRFTDFYAGSPVCAPSRYVLMTGLHGGHAYLRDNREVQPEGQWPIPDSTVTLAELLRARGYATGAFGKWGLGFVGSEGDPNRQGFDLFYGYNCQRQAHNFYPTHLWRNNRKELLEGNHRGGTGRQYSHDLIEAEALRFVREHRDRPFFLFVPFTIPHLALQVPEDSLAEYRGQWEDPPYDGKNGYLPHPNPRAAYAAMVTRMDRSVGRLMETLRQAGLDRQTIVLFTSDNGPTYDRLGGSDSDFFRSAGIFRGYKGSVYEGGIRVPLIARWPGHIKAGRTSALPAAFYDLLPTLVEIAGGQPHQPVDGISLVPTLTGRGTQPRHKFLFWDFNGYGGQQAVRYGDWKGVRRDISKGNRVLELYDLRRDPGERDDVARANPKIVQEIERILLANHEPSTLFPLPAVDQLRQ
ncbi:MAG: arylsulfatase [Blastocatellia bacterium]